MTRLMKDSHNILVYAYDKMKNLNRKDPENKIIPSLPILEYTSDINKDVINKRNKILAMLAANFGQDVLADSNNLLELKGFKFGWLYNIGITFYSNEYGIHYLDILYINPKTLRPKLYYWTNDSIGNQWQTMKISLIKQYLNKKAFEVAMETISKVINQKKYH